MYQGAQDRPLPGMCHCGVKHLLSTVATIATVRDMETGIMETTKSYPVGGLHADDDSECSNPDACGRMVYWPGGAALATFGE